MAQDLKLPCDLSWQFCHIYKLSALTKISEQLQHDREILTSVNNLKEILENKKGIPESFLSC